MVIHIYGDLCCCCLFFVLFYFTLFCLKRGLLCSLDWPKTPFIDQSGFDLIEIYLSLLPRC